MQRLLQNNVPETALINSVVRDQGDKPLTQRRRPVVTETTLTITHMRRRRRRKTAFGASLQGPRATFF